MKLGLYIQYQGGNISRDELINLVIEEVGDDASDIQVYFQPENNKVYYKVEKENKIEYGEIDYFIHDNKIDEDYKRLLNQFNLPEDIVPQKSINRRRFNLSYDHKVFATITYKENYYNLRIKKSLFDIINNGYEVEYNYKSDYAIIRDIPCDDTELLKSIIVVVKTGYDYDENNEEQEGKLFEKIKKLNDSELYLIAKMKSSGNKKRYARSVTSYNRYSIIREYTLRRAKGICQLCGNKAPFNKKDGTPYLESHHIEWLCNGGEDILENTVALCPNCHKKMHILNEKEDIEYLIAQNKEYYENINSIRGHSCL